MIEWNLQRWKDRLKSVNRFVDEYLYTGLGEVDDARIKRKEFTDSERLLIDLHQRTPAEAIRFVKQHAEPETQELSATIQFLLRKGTPPEQAVAFAKTPLTPFETALIMQGVPAVQARSEASQPLSVYDIKASIRYLIEEKDVDIRRPIATAERLILESERATTTKTQAYDALFMQADGAPLDLSAALPVVVADRVLNRSRPSPAPAATGDLVASAKRDDTQRAAGSAVLSGVSGEVLPTAARASELNAPHPVNELIMRALKGESLTRPQVRSVQTHLKNSGFDCGTIDEIMGAKSWEAVARYARAGHLKGEKVDASHLRHLEASLKTIGYVHIKVDGNVKDDSETRRALGKFFDIRATLKDLKPTDVSHPDIAAMAGVQAGYAKKRGIAAG